MPVILPITAEAEFRLSSLWIRRDSGLTCIAYMWNVSWLCHNSQIRPADWLHFLQRSNINVWWSSAASPIWPFVTGGRSLFPRAAKVLLTWKEKTIEHVAKAKIRTQRTTGCLFADGKPVTWLMKSVKEICDNLQHKQFSKRETPSEPDWNGASVGEVI